MLYEGARQELSHQDPFHLLNGTKERDITWDFYHSLVDSSSGTGYPDELCRLLVKALEVIGCASGGDGTGSVLGRLGTVISLDQLLKHEVWRFCGALLLAILAAGR